MPLENLLNIPKDQRAWEFFSFSNFDSHQQIIQAIKAKRNVNLNLYEIQPIPTSDTSSWLQNHAQLHNEFNAVLGIQGQDLQDVNLKEENQLIAWIYLHRVEHETAHQILGI